MPQGWTVVAEPTPAPTQAPPMTAAPAGWTPVAEKAPDFHVDVKASDSFSPSEMAGGLWENLNPIPMIKQLAALDQERFNEAQADAAKGDYRKAITRAMLPGHVRVAGDILAGLGKAQWDQAVKAYHLARGGRMVEALGHVTAALLPVIGPMEADAAETMAQPGQFSRGVGKALAPAVPSLLKKVLPTRISTPSLRGGMNAAEADAVQFGLQRDIPLDAATVSSNRFVRATQQMADRTPLGSLVAERASEQQAQGLARVGGELANQAHPAPVTMEQAGQGVRDAVTGTVKDFHAEATTQYERLRTIEADPARASTMQVPLQTTKVALKPIYDALMREKDIAPLMGGKARAAVALDRLMNAPDSAPLSVVDAALGDLKALARGADIPELRTQGQGVAAEAVKALDRQVRQTAARAGGDVVSALENGRKATVQKYAAADVLDDLISGTGDEPVRVTKRLTATQDTAITKLRDIQRLTPQELPKIGRAFLDTLLEKAQQKGGFGRTERLFADWHNLGPETKRLLFRDQGLVKDLDRFFLLAERMAVSTNPSGTALTAASWSTGIGLVMMDPSTGVPLVLGTGALSKLLHSPRAVRAFTRGMSMPVSNRVGAAAVTSEILKVAGPSAVPLPTAADNQGQQPATTGRR